MKDSDKEKSTDKEKKDCEKQSKQIDFCCQECAAYPCELSESGSSCDKKKEN